MATPKKYRNWEKLGKAAGGEKWFLVDGQAIYGSESMFASLPHCLIGDDCPVEESPTELFNGYPVNSLDYESCSVLDLSFKGVAEYLPSPAIPDEAGWMNTVLFKKDSLWVSDNEICLKVSASIQERHNLCFAVPRDAAKILKSATSGIVAMRVSDTEVSFEFLDQSSFTFKQVPNGWIDLELWFDGWAGPDCEQELPIFSGDIAHTVLSLIDKNGAKFVTFTKDKIKVLDKDGKCFFTNENPFSLLEVNEPATFGVKSLKKVMKMIQEGVRDEIEPHLDLRYAPYPTRFWFVDKQGRLVYGLLSCHGA